MKKIILFSIVIFCCLNISNLAQDKTKEVQKNENIKSESVQQINVKKPWNAVCPVKGNPIQDDTPTVEYNGKVYGFCCPGCDTKFAKNPEKYSKNLSEDGKKFVGKK